VVPFEAPGPRFFERRLAEEHHDIVADVARQSAFV
jgi:hypothetical protein